MLFKVLVLFLFFDQVLAASEDQIDFTYNGYRESSLSLGGISTIKPNGLLQLTNSGSKEEKGHAFYPVPLPFKNSSIPRGNTSSSTSTRSFSSTFIFAIVPDDPRFFVQGLAFVISPSDKLSGTLPAQYLGLFNASSNDGSARNHIFAVELDTSHDTKFGDINDNHVGIDINSLQSVHSAPAGYFANGRFTNFSLRSGDPIQVWIDYSGGSKKQLNVTVSPIPFPKPDRPLLSVEVDLDPVLLDTMYAGFSSATCELPAAHYILGWSFKMGGRSRPLNLSSIPSLPRKKRKEKSKLLRVIGFPLIGLTVGLVAVFIVAYFIWRKIKFAEVLEEWEHEYGPHRFTYRDLFVATRGFRDTELLGIGGFGRVYKGVLPKSKTPVAVKRVSHDSRQGMKEFVAEIVSLGRLRHRNLVQLLGYCRRKGELLLVYDYMPNGSLDRALFDDPNSNLNWSQRFGIIKGVASGLVYLHEEWEQIVLHRDIKASNVLLDAELNGRLGDFGLARLYDHGTAGPNTTHVVGTLGYMAPELTKSRRATTSTDVFAFGAFMLEVATGRRPIELWSPQVDQQVVLVDWVVECWKKGAILDTRDPKLGMDDFVAEEMELVLKLGLLCSNPVAGARPSMRQVIQFLERDFPFPESWFNNDLDCAAATATGYSDGISMRTSSDNGFLNSSSSVAESLLSGGR